MVLLFVSCGWCIVVWWGGMGVGGLGYGGLERLFVVFGGDEGLGRGREGEEMTVRFQGTVISKD